MERRSRFQGFDRDATRPGSMSRIRSRWNDKTRAQYKSSQNDCRLDADSAAAAYVRRTALALLTAVSFLLGAACSGVAGYVGMWVSVRANVRVSGAARRSAREALQIALRAGGFSALVVLGMVRAPSPRHI